MAKRATLNGKADKSRQLKTNDKPKRAASTSTRPTKKQKLESDVDDDDHNGTTSDEDDNASAYSDNKETSASVDEQDQAVTSDEDADEDEPSDSTIGDDDKPSSSKRKSPKGTKSKSSKDDRNIRVVKKVVKIPGPSEDPDTPVILPTTLKFLKDLVKHNDREWFHENDARYRHALANFTAFIQAWVPKATEADWSLPHLPAKELLQRIYRDVRFSKDKTPYKTWLGASHSRTGRKGPFALYYLEVGGKGRSLLAGGLWCPPADQTRMFRNFVLRDPAPVRRVLNDKTFIKYFGKPDPKTGGRTSVFGHSDELKNSPKIDGVTKDHKDIDLLKLRSVAVDHTFTDEQVLSPTFLDDHLLPCMKALAPFIQLLNEILFPSDDSDDPALNNDDNDNESDENEQGEEGSSEEQDEDEDEDEEDEDDG
ncbi:hypothetical protein OIO90_005548 [Microbotryomycetes sp. JL221]|nr:hypothetical protein OIO90_005548 [Microbotryomycetes sp. JL221]